jgi:hypothetical protein
MKYVPSMSKPNPICEIDVDEAKYLGGGDESSSDGVYFDAKQEGGLWYMSAIVDSDTGHFVDTLVQDDGPYPSYEEAMEAGINAALEWAMTNEVVIEDKEIDATRDAIHLEAAAASESRLR